ncbi:MAG TPA: MMPL family transporter [Solirubrobacteraceae bacterium]
MAGEQLRVTEGNARGEGLTVETELLLGRAMGVEGRLGDDPVLSRRHARLARDAEGRLTIEDLGSANGTFVNGERVEFVRTLEVGDLVSVGETVLEVTEEEPASAPAVESTEELLITDGPFEGRRLAADGLVLGRSVAGAGGMPDDPELSRRHARVARDAEGRLTIEDLGSANGTFVNGERVHGPEVLNVGDVVRVGLTTLHVVEAEPAPVRRAEGARLAAVADLATRGRVWILGAALVLTVAGVVFGAGLPGRLAAGDDFADSSSPSAGGERALAGAAGGIDPGPDVVAVVRASDGRIGSPALDAAGDAELARSARSPGAQRTVERVARVIRADPNIGRVLTYYQGAPAPFVSKDRRATYVLGFLRPGTDARATAKRLRPQLSFLTGVSLGGGTLVREAVARGTGHGLAVGLAIAFPLVYLLSLAVLRGFVAALVPLLVGVASVFVTLLALRLVDSASALSSFTLNLVIALGLGLAAVYSLLLVTRYREQAGSDARPVALRQTLQTMGRTVLFSTATVAVALLTLVIFPQRVLDSTGLGGAISALIAGAAALVVVPALLAALGERVDAIAPPTWQRGREETAAGERSGRWYRLSEWVVRRKVLVVCACGAVLLAIGLPALGLKSTGVDARVLSESSDPRQVANALQREFAADPTATIRLSVAAPPTATSRLGAYADQLRRLPDVAAVGTPTRLDRRTWQIDVQPARRAFDKGTRDLVDRIRGAPAPFPVAVTGEAAAFVDGQDVLASRLPLVLALLVLGTGVILFAMTRSVILPIVAVLINLLVLSAAFGLVVLIFNPLYSTQATLLLAVAFALSTALSLFVVAYVKEARDAGARGGEAVALGLERGAGILTAAALLLAVAVGAFAVSAIDFVELLVVGSVLAVLIHTTFARGLLVPAFFGLFGEREW